MPKRPTLCVAFLLVLSAPILADQEPSGVKVAPNLYELAHPGGGLIYQLDPVTGEPMRFAYRDRNYAFETASEGIRVQETELGQQITVELLQIPDLKTKTLTLVLPQVNLVRNDVQAPESAAIPAMFTTFVIVTNHRTSIAGPDILSGQIDLYGLRSMIGKAQFGTPEAPAQTSTGVIGRVLVEPTCPVVTEGQPPCVAPFAGARVRLTDDTQNLVYETVADARGLFAIEAPGGSYTLHATGDSLYPSCPEKKIVIPEVQIEIFPWPETREYAILSCDTGIR